MNKKKLAAGILAIIGTILVWFPILFTLVTGIIGSIQMKALRVDYLMPAEFFPFVGAGSILLIIAALLARSWRKYIIWCFVAMILVLVGGQAIAYFSGLATGEIEPQGFWWILVLSTIGLYTLGIIAMGVGGILLIKSCFTRTPAE